MEYVLNFIMELIDKYYPNIPKEIYIILSFSLIFNMYLCFKNKELKNQLNALQNIYDTLQNNYNSLMKSSNTGGKLTISKVNEDSTYHIEAENISDDTVKELIKSSNSGENQ